MQLIGYESQWEALGQLDNFIKPNNLYEMHICPILLNEIVNKP